MSGIIPPDILTTAGHPESVAAVLHELSKKQMRTIRQISSTSGLSISQVSSGLKLCRYQGWVSASQGEAIGKGRPQHLWELNVSPIDLVQELESDSRSKQVILSAALKRLREKIQKND